MSTFIELNSANGKKLIYHVETELTVEDLNWSEYEGVKG